jgi:nucleoside phosphorylase
VARPLEILVVAAWEPELTHFRALASSRLGHSSLRIATLGVGLVDAAIAMTQRIAEGRPDLALFTGTCGSLAGDLAIGDVVAASQVVLEGTGELPQPMVAEVTLDTGWHHALVAAGARSAHVVNTVGITVDDTDVPRLARRGHVEHLEAFAFARACAIAGVPAGVVLGVANPVGAAGRAAWRANHARASARAAEVAAEVLVRTTTTAPTPATP